MEDNLFQIALNTTAKICDMLIKIGKDLERMESEGKITHEELVKLKEMFFRQVEKSVDKIWKLYWEYTNAQQADRDCSLKH